MLVQECNTDCESLSISVACIQYRVLFVSCQMSEKHDKIAKRMILNCVHYTISPSKSTCPLPVMRVCANILSNFTVSITRNNPCVTYCWYGRLSPLRNPSSRSFLNIVFLPSQNLGKVAFANCSTLISVSEVWTVFANSTRGALIALISSRASISSACFDARRRACANVCGIWGVIAFAFSSCSHRSIMAIRSLAEYPETRASDSLLSREYIFCSLPTLSE